jgi:hypothetical protein
LAPNNDIYGILISNRERERLNRICRRLIRLPELARTLIPRFKSRRRPWTWASDEAGKSSWWFSGRITPAIQP